MGIEHGRDDAGRRLRLRLLGPVEGECGDDPLPLGGPKQRAVLAILALHANTVVSATRLIEAVWEEASPGLGRTLQVHVSNLRRLVEGCGGANLHSVRGGYRLELPPGALDLDRFEEFAGQGRHALGVGEADRAGRHLRAALDLVAGTPLEGLPDTPQLQRAADRIEDAVLAVREDAIEAAILAGHHRSAIRELEGLAGDHPYRERLTELLMWSLYLEGRQAEALERYRAARERFVTRLGVEPGPDLRRMHEAILQHAEHLGVGWRTPVYAVPRPAYGLVDREDELSRLTGWLRSDYGGPVCIVGMGGCGKTRLAIEAAHVLGPAFPDGVRFVDLSTTSAPEEFGPTLAAALEVAPRLSETALAAVTRWLSGQRMLLILDTFEPIVEAAGEVARLCSVAPALRVLVTSRLPLELHDQRELRLDPLPTPDEDMDIDGLRGVPAVRLLLERAHDRHAHKATPEMLRAAGRICRRLDGLPLALELAAARTDRLPLTHIADRLDDLGFLRTSGLDVPDRQRTLQATLDWTLDLLAPDSRELFWRLGVFHGGCNHGALASVAGHGWDDERLRDAMDPLITASLIEVDGTGRYVMLETVRSHARSRMSAHPERAAVESRHTDHYLSMVDTIAGRVHTPDEVTAAKAVQRELANIRQALHRCRHQGEHARAAEASLKLLRFFRRAGHAELEAESLQHLLDTFEGLPPNLQFGAAWAAGTWFAERDRAQAERWLHRARNLGREFDDTEPPYGVILTQLAQVLIIGGKESEALPIAEEALEATSEDAGVPRAFALFATAWAHQCLGELTQARALARQSLRSASGSGTWRAWPLLLLSRIAMLEGRAENAAGLAKEVLEMAEDGGDQPLRCAATAHLGWAAHAAGESSQSLRWWLETLQMAHELERPFTIGNCLCAVAGCLATAGERDAALRLWGAAEAIQATTGVICAHENGRLYHELWQRTEEQLGDHGHTLRAAGAAMPLDEAVALAMETGRRIA